MGFLDMGALEILLILVVALIIWGPDKVPGIARTLGKTLRNLRKATTDFTATLTKELTAEEKDQPSQPEVNTSNDTKESSDKGTTESRDEAVKQEDQ